MIGGRNADRLLDMLAVCIMSDGVLAVGCCQGCMNNFTFGDATMGYYETIAGGAGAGPSWHGRSGVHTHMTNTRITGATSSMPSASIESFTTYSCHNCLAF